MDTLTVENAGAKTGTIRILVVDDQEVVRLGLKLGLTDINDMEVVAEAGDGESAISIAREIKPDVILMDIGLPVLDGIQATRAIKQSLDTRILILSSHSEEETVLSALRAGADGFCLKDASTEKVVTAIRAVAKGSAWLSEGISENVLRSIKLADPETTNQHASLTATELKVLNLIFEGDSIESIAQQLGYSVYDVMVFTNRVLQKVAVNTSSENNSDVDNPARKITGEHTIAQVCPHCYEIFNDGRESCPFDGSSTKEDKIIGTVFAERYDILGILGSGSGGSVYKARHKFMQKLVAIKILHGNHMSDLEMLRRFRQEAATTSMLSHHNIVSVSDFGFSESGEPFMIMDYIEGVSLGDLLVEKNNLTQQEAIPIFIQICRGLQAAHDHGIIHRDLKPGNVIVSGFGSKNLHVQIADFGIAKLTRPLVEGQLARTGMGEVFGSPFYMSPEQCMGLELDHVSDVYSMGCLMYNTLAGRPPAIGKDAMDVMYKKIHDELTPIGQTPLGSTMSNYLQAVIMKALKFNKFDRFQSMQELEAILIDFEKNKGSIKITVARDESEIDFEDTDECEISLE